MHIVIDLDGTICELKKTNESYTEVLPKSGVVDALNKFLDRGDTITIFTARHMKTCNNDIQLVKQRIEQVTKDWLKRHQIPYHHLIFGKPYGDVYIDDLAIQFTNWDDIMQKL